jgi:acyl transferase domain-containing protein
MFPGQAAQYVNMGSEVYRTEKEFSDTVDFCCEILKPHLGFDLRRVLYPRDDEVEEAENQLSQTAVTQPALFVLEYALAKLWIKWSISPDAMIGHSIGEYVAACLAGVFAPEDALKLVAARGRLMQKLPGGSMLAVRMEEQALRHLLGDELSLAVINGPSLCVAAGPTGAIKALERLLTEKQVGCRFLRTSHAFHSQMMEPILSALHTLFEGVKLSPPKIPYLSNLTGTWITPGQATDPGYWTSHLRQTVRFSDGVGELLKTPHRILLEVGPGQMLATITRPRLSAASGQIVLPSFGNAKDGGSDLETIIAALGRLWTAGVHVDWPAFYVGQRRFRIPLPAYPFERRRHWIEAGCPVGAAPSETVSQRADSNAGAAPHDSEVQPAPVFLSDSAVEPQASAAAYVAPRNEIEERVAGIWQEVLGVERVGVNDKFSELGGDSLLATQVLSRVRNTFKVALPVDSLFASPTVADLAELVRKARETPIGDTEKISQLLKRVEQLSEEDLKKLAAQGNL